MANRHGDQAESSPPGPDSSFPDSSLDLPGSSYYYSSPTAPSLLDRSSPLAQTSTPDSSFLDHSILSRHGPHKTTARFSNSSALGKLVNDDWKTQTEEQRRGLEASHTTHHSLPPTQPWAFKFDSRDPTIFKGLGQYEKQDHRTPSKPFSHDRHGHGAVPPKETAFDFVRHATAPVSNSDVDARLLSSLRGLSVNDYSAFNNPPSSGSDEDSMAYLSPFRGGTASLNRGPSTGGTPWNGLNDSISHPSSGVTERQMWGGKAPQHAPQHQTADRFPTAAGSTQAPGPSMASSMWAPPQPTGAFFPPSNQLIQQHPQLAPLPFPPIRPLPPLPSDSVFHPMESRPLDKNVTGVAAMDLMVKGFSPNYRGNPDLERNRSAPIPPDQNCSLFITGLAPTLTTRQLLATIRDVGRVYATHINFPEPDRGHFTCAAKVVFFERRAAERFYERYAGSGFRVAGADQHVGRVVWNRIRSAEQDVGGRKSRVLLISGPPSVVSEEALGAYFDTKIQYQVDEVRTLRTYAAASAAQGGAGERALVEFRFGSYRCQSEAAKMALSREFKEFGVYCDFGQDPCDLASSFLPGKENIDNDPAFASSASQPDENQYPEQYLGKNWRVCNQAGNGER